MAVATVLDGANIDQYVQEGSVTHTLNGKSTAVVKLPIDVGPGGINSALAIAVDGGANFYGKVQHVDEQAEEDTGYVVYTAVDPSNILEYKIARDFDGDFSKPSFVLDYPTGPQMLEEILANSITYEGSLGFSTGSFATGGVNLSGIPVDWPMSVSEILGLLVQTGEVDCIFTPSGSGVTLNVYNGDYGADRSGSVNFQYAMGTSSNCRACRRTTDASEIMNKLWIYLGPKLDDQHWRGNITGDHPELPGLAGHAAAAAAISSSRAAYLQRMQVRILDADYVAAHKLYLHWWIRESLLRANPKTLVHLTPHRGIAPSFGVGDKIHVQAGTSFRGGFSGTQRVYEMTYRWDQNGTIELGEPVGQAGAPAVVTSGDQEALA